MLDDILPEAQNPDEMVENHYWNSNLSIGVTMGKTRNILRFVQWLLAMLFLSSGASAFAEEARQADPRVEKIRRDLGYYQPGEAAAISTLETEIRGLREEFLQMRESHDGRLQRIENALKLNVNKETARAQSPPLAPTPDQPANGSKTLSVCGRGCDYRDLQKAVDAALPGGEISIEPEINGTCAVISKPLRIFGKQGADGRRAHLAGGVCMGKAALVTAAPNIVIEGLEISGIAVGDGDGACLRLDPHTLDLTVRNLYCHDSQDGILGASEGRLLIEDSVFIGNGFDNGQAHGLYISGGDEVLIRRSRILASQNAGHLLKSGARKLIVEDSILAALNGHNSRVLDAYGGGEIVLRHNVIQQGPQSDNSDMIGLALEPARLLPDGHSLRLEDNWVIFDYPGRGFLIRGRKLGPVTVSHNTFVGLDKLGLDGVEDVGNRWFATRKEAGLPPFDGTLASLPKNTQE